MHYLILNSLVDTVNEGRFGNGFIVKAVTLLVSAILALLCAVGVAGKYQSFTKLRNFHQHVGVARVQLSISDPSVST